VSDSKIDPALIAAAGRYEFIVTPNAHGGYHVRVPAFPTVFTGGLTPAEAADNAVEAIALALEWYAETRAVPPAPCVTTEAA
jgi:predicted RNase H-like HicB family nuclease